MIFCAVILFFIKIAYWMVLSDQEGLNPSDVLRGVRQSGVS